MTLGFCLDPDRGVSDTSSMGGIGSDEECVDDPKMLLLDASPSFTQLGCFLGGVVAEDGGGGAAGGCDGGGAKSPIKSFAAAVFPLLPLLVEEDLVVP